MNSSYKELFAMALSDAMSQKYDAEIALCKSESAVCSPAHTDAIRKLVGLPKKSRIGLRFSKRTVIAVLLAVALLLTGCTAFIFREEIRGWFMDEYPGFSSNPEERSTLVGSLDFSIEKRYYPVDEVEVELYFGLFAERYSWDYEEYYIKIYDTVNNVHRIFTRDATVYPEGEFAYYKNENGEYQYNHSEMITIPKDMLMDADGNFYEYGSLKFDVYLHPQFDLYRPISGVGYSLYYRTDGETVELSSYKNDYAVFTAPIYEWNNIRPEENSEHIESILKEYKFKAIDELRSDSPVTSYDVGVREDELKAVRHYIAIGGKTAFGSRISIARFGTCREDRGYAGASFAFAIQFNYKGDFSLEWADPDPSVGEGQYDLNLYLWDDGIVLRIRIPAYEYVLGEPTADFEIVHSAEILRIEENIAVKEKMEKMAFESKSFERWDYRVEHDGENPSIIVSNKDGEECVVFSDASHASFFEKIFGNRNTACHKHHISIP